MFENIKIVPIPKVFELGKSYLKLEETITISFDKNKKYNEKRIVNILHKISPCIQIIEKNAFINFAYKDFEDEEYELIIDSGKIIIFASNEKGWFYGIQTLRQIIIDDKVPYCKIKDKPDLKLRGVSLDISRSKVPKVETLKRIFDLLAFLKYNHIELYVEGFSFEYASFPNVLNEKNYLTKAEYFELENYANDLFLDFVPNQNSFGHMEAWLEKPEYHHLAECEEGFTIWGAYRKSSTLNPLDDNSVKHVAKMYGDMLPDIKSKYFNMCFDEPYELGFGKSKDVVKNTSVEDVFIEYLHKLAQVTRTYKKIPLIWADVVIKHPEVIDKIDKDIILIDWGYVKDYPFSEHAKMLNKHKRDFILAGGTSTWSVITSRYDDMYYSIKNSAIAAKENNGLGIIVTDWGDIGHLQYLPMSYLGFIQGALVSWSDVDNDALIYLLEKIVGKENAKSIIELSKYTKLEGPYRDYGSRLFSAILWSEHSTKYENRLEFFKEKMKSNYLSEESINDIYSLLIKEKNRLTNIKEDKLVTKEILNSIDLLLILLSINKKLQINCSNYDKELESLEQYKINHLELWNERNKESGFKFSINRIIWLKQILVQMSRKGEKHE